MQLTVIRHTKVDVLPGICYGQSDVGLAGSFQQEKESVAKLIEQEKFDAIFCSPLKRCRHLAEALFEKENIVFDKRIKELNFGDWEMLTWDAIFAQPKGEKWMNNYQTLPTLNGESYDEMFARVAAFLEDIGKTGNENIVVVTHAGVVRLMKSIIDETSIDELFTSFKPNYGSVTRFEL